MRWDFETGVAFGKALASIRALDVRLSRIERKVRAAESYLRRGLMVAALWGSALTLKLNAEEAAQLLATLARALLSRP